MSDQLEQQNNQSIPRLQAWLYWIDTDGMKIGIAIAWQPFANHYRSPLHLLFTAHAKAGGLAGEAGGLL